MRKISIAEIIKKWEDNLPIEIISAETVRDKNGLQFHLSTLFLMLLVAG